MPTQKLTQNSFTSGQYDRAVQGKERSELVASGLAKAMNVVSSESGELRKRLGTKHLLDLDKASVIVPFRNDEDDMLLLFGGNTLDVFDYNDDGTVSTHKQSKLQLLEKDWTSNTTDGYTVNCSRALVASETYKAFRLPVDLPNDDRRLNGFAYAKSETLRETSMWLQLDCPEPQSLGKVSVVFAVGWWHESIPSQPYDGYTNATLQYSDDGSTWIPIKSIITSEVGEGVSYKVVYTKQTRTEGQPLVNHRLYPENRIIYDVVASGDSGKHKHWRIVFTDRLKTTGYAEDINEPKKVHVQCFLRGEESEFKTTSTDITDLKNIKYAQSSNLLKVVDGKTHPVEIEYNAGIIYSKWHPQKPSESAAENLWQFYGFPSCVSYFQNRLWFGGFSSSPTTVLASKFNNESDFTINSTAQYDDALKLKSNELKSKIVNMVGGRNVLYCMSQDGISFIDGGSTGLLATNQNIEFHLKNPMPAGDSAPIHKDGVLLYGSADGTKLYSVDYDLLVERFQVDDVAKYAKDVVKAKITELQYVNNETKLVYGLTETNEMFCLLYVKGVYQGFYPINIQDGFVYDISVIKKGRNYKLIMVVNRSGKWYLEEKLDKGEYKPTSDPLMTLEDKKWATYDNLENNIALDCYKTYENAVYGDIDVDGDVAETTVDLEKYVGQTVMFAQENSKDFLQAEIEKINTTKLYAWKKGGATGEPVPEFVDREYIYTLEPKFPGSYKPYYQENAKPIGDVINDRVVGYESMKNDDDVITIGLSLSSIASGYSSVTYVREESSDIEVQTSINIKKLAQRGDSNYYTKVLLPFDTFKTQFVAGAEVGVVSQGRYMGEFVVDDNGYVVLPFPVNKVIYGATYESYGIIKIQKPYESMKSVQQINLSVIDTAHLQVGTGFNDLQELELIKDDSHYDLTNITMNGSYRIVPSDTPEWDKYIILRSVKGLPFTVVGVEAFVNYSNTGGN